MSERVLKAWMQILHVMAVSRNSAQTDMISVSEQEWSLVFISKNTQTHLARKKQKVIQVITLDEPFPPP